MFNSINIVSEVRDALNELLYLHQLNVEMLEALGILAKHLIKYERENNVPFNESTITAMEKVGILCDEMLSPHQTIAYPKSLKLPAPVFDDRDPEELPEPKK